MIKQRILRVAVTVGMVAGMAGGLGVLTAGTSLAAAHGTQAATPDYEITVHTTSAGDWFFPSSGGAAEYLPANDTVDVTCYYIGSKSYNGDKELDHVTYTQKYGNVPGHIPDFYVNFGGLEASQAGVPKC